MRSLGLLMMLTSLLAIGCGGSTTTDRAGTGGVAGVSASGGTAGTDAGVAGSGASGAVGGSDAGSCGTCAAPADCTLVPASCCLCGMPELADYVASSKDGGCGAGGLCCQCLSGINPNLAATCSAGTCQGFDVRQVDAYSACQVDADCKLRVGLACCEGCASSGADLVAVKTDTSALSQALCGNAPVACDACAPVYPPDAKAACVAGHCSVVSG